MTDYTSLADGPLVLLRTPGNVVTGRIRSLPNVAAGERWAQMRGRSGSRFAVCVPTIFAVTVLAPAELADRPDHVELLERLAEMAGIYVDVAAPSGAGR